MKTVQHWDTPVITAERWPRVFQTLVHLLTSYGVAEVVTLHGWTESAFADHPQFERYGWAEMPARVTDLPGQLEERQALGFTLGRDDWRWKGSAPNVGLPFELLLCHEGDLHLETGEWALAQTMAGTLAGLGVPLNQRKRG